MSKLRRWVELILTVLLNRYEIPDGGDGRGGVGDATMVIRPKKLKRGIVLKNPSSR